MNLNALIEETKSSLVSKRYELLNFDKRMLTVGSLQSASSNIGGKYNNCYGFNEKINVLPKTKVVFNVPCVDGVYYKYRIGFYDHNGIYIKQIDQQESNEIIQDDNCDYIMFCVYAYNISSRKYEILTKNANKDNFSMMDDAKCFVWSNASNSEST